MAVRINVFWLVLFTICFVPVLGQNFIVTGLITDRENNPIEDVLVKSNAPNYSINTKTNTKGEFKLSLPDTVNNLTITKPGYKSVNSQVNSSCHLNITLELSDLLVMSLEDILKTNVNTVTLKEEKITEAPGIVTVITGEELRTLGIRTVREALTLVPGFSPLQNDDEMIFAMRGIYATSNQKILVMRDGHSYNEGNLDIPQFEYSLSIENIKKIEIIRGPGASIYGNSAFAAVVNIITADSEGIRAKVGFGNYGQFNFDAYISQKVNSNSSFLAYGRYASNQGQPFDVNINGPNAPENTKGTYYAYHYPRNYDVGIRYKSRFYTSSLSVRRHCYKTYWSAEGYHTNVDSIFIQPRLFQNSIHYDLNFDLEVHKNVNLTLQNYIDYSILTNYRLVKPIDTLKYLHGYVQNNEWNVLKAGTKYYTSWKYSLSGTIISGIAFEHRKYLDSWLMSNALDSSRIVLSIKPFYPENHESRGAAFIQLHHTVTPWLRIDGGVRYDIAEDFDATLNPRLALIFYPFNPFTIKLIYTKAFQAPGYSYRNSVAAFSGSVEPLQSEIINTFQWSAHYDFEKASFIEISAFYNRLNNFITRPENLTYYTNIGKMSSYGMEIESRINIEKYSIFANYSLLLPDTLNMDDKFRLNIHNNRFKNMPMHSANAGITYHYRDIFDFSVYGQYASSFYSVNDVKLDQRLILNTSLRLRNIYKYGEIDASIYNFTNHLYYLGDPSVRALPQPGTWIMISIVTDIP
ncbi:MAG: TonB-dependent receptor [Bacteroidales bacterium]|nr:TonB-dependent receptor [Bacteroidales bacterium]